MKQSENGRRFLKLREACRLQAYLDGGGVWTIGWGHTGKEVHKGLVWSQSQADAAYLTDIAPRERALNKLVKVPLTQNQFDALLSFLYNIGLGAFKQSSLLAILNMGKHDSVPYQMRRWNKDNGAVVQGLTNRRELEIELFNTP